MKVSKGVATDALFKPLIREEAEAMQSTVGHKSQQQTRPLFNGVKTSGRFPQYHSMSVSSNSSQLRVQLRSLSDAGLLHALKQLAIVSTNSNSPVEDVCNNFQEDIDSQQSTITLIDNNLNLNSTDEEALCGKSTDQHDNDQGITYSAINPCNSLSGFYQRKRNTGLIGKSRHGVMDGEYIFAKPHAKATESLTPLGAYQPPEDSTDYACKGRRLMQRHARTMVHEHYHADVPSLASTASEFIYGDGTNLPKWLVQPSCKRADQTHLDAWIQSGMDGMSTYPGQLTQNSCNGVQGNSSGSFAFKNELTSLVDASAGRRPLHLHNNLEKCKITQNDLLLSSLHNERVLSGLGSINLDLNQSNGLWSSGGSSEASLSEQREGDAIDAPLSFQTLLMGKELLDRLLASIESTGETDPSRYAGEILNTCLSLIGQSPSNKDQTVKRKIAQKKSMVWMHGIGGPHFSAPAMLAHPDEFKNPSSFLKIYGDPMCGLDTASGATIMGCHGNSVTGLHPILGQDGNWQCAVCKNVNFPRRFRCNKCGEVRGEDGDAIVTEYAKHVYKHHLSTFRMLAASQGVDIPLKRLKGKNKSGLCEGGVDESSGGMSGTRNTCDRYKGQDQGASMMQKNTLFSRRGDGAYERRRNHGLIEVGSRQSSCLTSSTIANDIESIMSNSPASVDSINSTRRNGGWTGKRDGNLNDIFKSHR